MANLLNKESVVFMTATLCPPADSAAPYKLYVGRSDAGNELHVELDEDWVSFVRFFASPKTMRVARTWIYANDYSEHLLDEQIQNHRVRVIEPGGTFDNLSSAFKGLRVETLGEFGKDVPGIASSGQDLKQDFPRDLSDHASHTGADIHALASKSLLTVSELLRNNEARIAWADYGRGVAI